MTTAVAFRRRAFATFVVLAGLAAACDDDRSPLIIEEPAAYLAELRAAECEHLVRCHVFADAAQCAHRIEHPGLLHQVWSRPPGEAAWVDHVAGGTMRFDPVQAGACIEAVRRGACALEERFPACWKVFQGIAPVGAVTSSDEQCVNRYWSTMSCDEACCTGICGGGDGTPVGHPVTIDGIGDFCGADRDGFVSCPSHLACRDYACALLGGTIECPAGLICDGRCRRRDELGERCTRGVDGDSCAHIGAWCGDDGRCQALALEDEACSAAVPCRYGMHCDPDTSRCIAAYGEGEVCSSTSAPCEAGLACRFVGDDARCVPTGVEPPVCD
jgi:hypothetical protein